MVVVVLPRGVNGDRSSVGSPSPKKPLSLARAAKPCSISKSVSESIDCCSPVSGSSAALVALLPPVLFDMFIKADGGEKHTCDRKRYARPAARCHRNLSSSTAGTSSIVMCRRNSGKTLTRCTAASKHE